MKQPAQPISLRKAIRIIFAGFVCGFCVVSAGLTYSQGHTFTLRVWEFVGGAILAAAGGFVAYRLG